METIVAPSLTRDPERHYYLPEMSCPLPMEAITSYKKGKTLGRGSYGKVIQAHKGGKHVAIKIQKLVDDDDELSSSTLREVAVMRRICQRDTTQTYIVPLHALAPMGGKVGMIMPLAKSSLKDLYSSPQWSSAPRSKYIYQITYGVAYLHSRDILHRDLKPQNILYDEASDSMMIADFGLARALNCASAAGVTHEVVTLWYRPPEILLGESKYGYPVDIWSLGCIIYEIMNDGTALFTGDSEIDQLFRIFRILGTPTDAEYPGLTNLPEYKANWPKWKVGKKAPFPKDSIFHQTLVYNPAKRISAYDLINDPIFEALYTKDIPALTCLDNFYLREPPLSQNLFASQADVNLSMRDILVDWLVEVHRMFKLRVNTFFLAIYFLDTYLPIDIPRKDLQTWGCACMYVASVYHEIYAPEPNDFVYLGDGGFSKDQLLTYARLLLENSGYDLVMSTSHDFLREYCNLFYSTAIYDFAEPLLYLTVFGMQFKLKAHEQALWAIYWACIYHKIEYKHDALLASQRLSQMEVQGPSNTKLKGAIKRIEFKTKRSMDVIKYQLNLSS